MTTPRPYTMQEVQRAARALLSGEFRTAVRPAPEPETFPPSLETTLPNPPPANPPPAKLPTPSKVLRIWAGVPGVGASTWTLALADAIEASGGTVRIIDAAPPGWSRLVSASHTEVGGHALWRSFRRGQRILIDRPNQQLSSVSEVPAPRALHAEWTLIDLGWTARELLAQPSWVTQVPATEVLLTRSEQQDLSQCETVLSWLHSAQVWLGVVEQPLRRSSAVSWAGAGPRLRALIAAQRNFSVPRLRNAPNLATDLPTPLLRAADRFVGSLVGGDHV